MADLIIGKFMAKNIREHGGDIHRNTEVKKIVVEDGKLDMLNLQMGRMYMERILSPICTR